MSNNQNTQTPPKMKGHGPMGGPGGGHGPVEKAKDVKGTTKKISTKTFKIQNSNNNSNDICNRKHNI